MPKKPIDEDRIRRKELLEQKKAARKTAKEKEEAARSINAATTASTNASNVSSSSSLIIATATTTTSNDFWNISFMDLPLDAIHLIFSMLCVKDLGRLRMVYDYRNSSSSGTLTQQQHFHHLLYTSRTSYLLSRLYSTTTTSTTMTNNNTSGDSIPRPITQFCKSEQEARTLLDDIWEIGNQCNTDTDKNAPKPSMKKKILQKHQQEEYDSDERQKVQQFLCFLRFIEEIVTGYATLTSPSRRNNHHHTNTTAATIVLPKFVHGRFVSVSPEHSVIRMGGTMHHNNRHGNCSGIATWGVGKRGQLGQNQRADLRHPTRLRYGIGYTTQRIVQVSARSEERRVGKEC